MRISNTGPNQLFIISHNDIVSVVSTTVSTVLSHLREEQTLLKKLYTRAEAARFLKVTAQTVSAYVKNGLLKPAYTGRKMLFTHEQLITFTKSNGNHRWKM